MKLFDIGMNEAEDGELLPTLEELQRSFPQYEIISFIGRGGMGAVYKARQRALDRPVAIKVLPPDMSDRPDFAVRFEREAFSMARLNHPNIITVYDHGRTEEGRLYIVMEFVDGRDLADLIRTGDLDGAKCLALAAQLCDALAYAHSEGIVHRDIKPANVIVDSRGRAKVADFGLARLVGPEPDAFSLTATGTVLGTAEYMAPEQKGGRSVDHRADIYSLGVVLYEMLCRELPQGIFTPPSKRSGCDVRIDDIVNRAMQQSPEERYGNTQEMKADVEVVRTTKDRLPPAPVARRRRRKTWAIAVAVVVVVALGAALWMQRQSAVKRPIVEGGPSSSGTPLGEVTPLPDPKVVAEKLLSELAKANKGFNPARATWKAENGVLTELTLEVAAVTDISAVSTVKTLRHLQLGRANEAGKVDSLEALKGLKLDWLEIHNCPFVDLEPLRGMPLRWFVCQGSKIKDLSPLKNAPLGALGINDSQVADLTPLVGMPLRFLNCGYTQVHDLSPLAGTPLIDLNISHTGVDDLAPLTGLKLTRFLFSDTPVRDISALQGMPLKSIECEYKPGRDREVLKSIQTLEKINGMRSEDFWRIH